MEIADRVQTGIARSKRLDSHWFSRPRLLTVAPYSSSDLLASLTPLALAVYRPGRSSVRTAMGYQGPDDPGCFVRQRDGDEHVGLASEHAG